jgi:hypothetical protein
MSFADARNPPIGFYWMGWDKKPRSALWLQSATAAEMIVMHKKGDFNAGEVKDKIPYGKSIRVEVSSRTNAGEIYSFSLHRMPIFSSDRDPEIYSYWLNMEHTSSDPFASYMAEHEQQALTQCHWSTTAATGVYLSMMHLNEVRHPLRFRVNPFPIPSNKKEVDFIDDARLKSLLLTRDENCAYSLKPLNKSEINRILGARTILREYDNCWIHMKKKGDRENFDYLYTRPKK